MGKCPVAGVTFSEIPGEVGPPAFARVGLGNSSFGGRELSRGAATRPRPGAHGLNWFWEFQVGGIWPLFFGGGPAIAHNSAMEVLPYKPGGHSPWELPVIAGARVINISGLGTLNHPHTKQKNASGWWVVYSYRKREKRW